MHRPCLAEGAKQDPGNLGLKLSEGQRLIVSRPRHRAVSSGLEEKLPFCMAKNEGERPCDVTPIKRRLKLASKAVHDAHNLKPFRLRDLEFQLLGEAF